MYIYSIYIVFINRMSRHKNKITTNTLTLKPILTNEELKKKEGHYFNEDYYTKHNKIVTTNTDVYGIQPDGTHKLLFKFRKNVIPEHICSHAYYALEKHAKHKNSNRGAAAGKLSLKKLPKHVGQVMKADKFRVFYKTKNGKVSRDNVSNIAQSNIAGYYDRPDRNMYNHTNTKSQTQTRNKQTKKHKSNSKYKSNTVPMCRTTQFTKKNVEKWKNTIPLIKAADKLFKKLVPDRYKIQIKRAKQTPDYQIDNTAYSTITVNYNWRTAAHCDNGDLDEGFGNLIVLEKSKSKSKAKSQDKHDTNTTKSYTGGYLGFPKWGICVDVRQGDFLAMDVHEYHCNTPIIGDGRLSVVCYLRKKMIQCSSFSKKPRQKQDLENPARKYTAKKVKKRQKYKN